MAYIYQFINHANEVIYVGHTQNLQNRMRQHFGPTGHLDEMVYKEVVRVAYAEKESLNEVRMYELYYISQHQPKYNTLLLEDMPITVRLPELAFQYLGVDEIKGLRFQDASGVTNAIAKELIHITFSTNWIATNCGFNREELQKYTTCSKEDIDYLMLKNDVLLKSKDDILAAVERIKKHLSAMQI